MPFTLTMPKLSPTMEMGTITKWMKVVGDLVKAGDVVFEVATDKATVEYVALDDGYLRKIICVEHQEARVNEAVAIFSETSQEDISSYIPEGLPVKIEVNPTSQSEYVPIEITTEERIKKTSDMPLFTPEPALEGYQFPFSCEPNKKISPYAKKIAKEKGLDLSTIQGSGPGGRIVSRDLNLCEAKSIVSFQKNEIPSIAPGTYELEPLTPMRKVIAKRLQESKTWIPHFYVKQDVDVELLLSIRNQLKEGGIKVTINDFMIRAVALTLREHPVINSGFDSSTNSIIRFKTIDIAVAVSVEAGLITPIVRCADYKSLSQIGVEVKALAEKAKKGKLVKEEYMGGSFTVSNLGMFGISEFQGIINPPQAAILSVSGIQERPVVKEGKIVPGNILNVSISSDHRVIDGTDAAKFLKRLQFYLENPALLLL